MRSNFNLVISSSGREKFERMLVKKLADKLRKRQNIGEVFTHRNPARSPKVYEALEEIYGGLSPRLQPEIDIILLKDNDMRAIEVKSFREVGKRLNYSYYVGIDQALALLMYGFDKVALWQIFDQPIDLKKLITYGTSTQAFVREQLELPIDFTVIHLVKVGNEYDFYPLKPIVNRQMEPVTAHICPKIDDPSFQFTWQTTNPLLDYPRIMNIRKATMEWLRTKQ